MNIIGSGREYVLVLRVKKLDRGLGGQSEEKFFELGLEGYARTHHTDKDKRYSGQQELFAWTHYSKWVSPPPLPLHIYPSLITGTEFFLTWLSLSHSQSIHHRFSQLYLGLQGWMWPQSSESEHCMPLPAVMGSGWAMTWFGSRRASFSSKTHSWCLCYWIGVERMCTRSVAITKSVCKWTQHQGRSQESEQDPVLKTMSITRFVSEFFWRLGGGEQWILHCS